MHKTFGGPVEFQTQKQALGVVTAAFTGYSQPSVFSEEFRKFFGMSPSSVRDNARAHPEAAPAR